MCLVICEGKYDTLFLQEVIENNSRMSTDRYHGSKEDRMYGQRDYMKSFPYMDEDILLKGEGGKTFQRDIYKSLILVIDRLFDNYFLLLDLDSGKPETAFSKIKREIKERYEPNQSIRMEKKILDENDLFYHLEFKGSIANQEFETPIIAFKTNLEEAAGINKKEDDKHDKKRKVKELVDKKKEVNSFIKRNLLENI